MHKNTNTHTHTHTHTHTLKRANSQCVNTIFYLKFNLNLNFIDFACMLISLNDLPKISLWNTAHIAELPQQRNAYNSLEKVEFHSKWN